MRSSKSRSRNKSNRPRPLGNVVSRVFDSSGPEGKVRGTPQQIIEKYLALARDAQLGNDRVAEQSYLQHAEHYTRMLGEAMREQAERQQQSSATQQGGQSREDGEPRQDDRDDRQDRNPRQDRGGSDRPGHDRNNHGDRQERAERPDRTERPDRNDRQERTEREDRNGERTERHASNGNGNGNGTGHQPRSPRRDDAPRPMRDDAPRPMRGGEDTAAEAELPWQSWAARDSNRDDTGGLPDAVTTSDADRGPVDLPESGGAASRRRAPAPIAPRDSHSPAVAQPVQGEQAPARQSDEASTETAPDSVPSSDRGDAPQAPAAPRPRTSKPRSPRARKTAVSGGDAPLPDQAASE